MTHDPDLIARRYDRERRARKEAEHLLDNKCRALYTSNKELRDTLDQIQMMQSQLVQSEKMASVGQLAAGVAHEINNPIGFISSNLNSLHDYIKDITVVLTAGIELRSAVLNGDPDAKTKAMALDRVCEEIDLEYILGDLDNVISESIEGVNRVRKIISDLRDFSHIDNPDLTLASINDLIDKTLTVAANELKYKADIVCELGDVPDIPCYGGKISQVILNLLVNAAQAMIAHGTITVRTGCRGEVVWIEINDTGCGISEHNLLRIFDPFFTTKPVGKGTGLGLHLSSKIIEAHGGRIEANSTKGEGTTFRIELPIDGPPEQSVEETHSGRAA